MKQVVYVSIKLPTVKVQALYTLYLWAMDMWEKTLDKEDKLFLLLGVHMEDMILSLEDIVHTNAKRIKIRLTKPQAAAFALTWQKLKTEGVEKELAVIAVNEIIAEIDKQSLTNKKQNIW